MTDQYTDHNGGVRPFESPEAGDHADAPMPPKDLGEKSRQHGRIGYGRYARFSPALLALLIVAIVAAAGIRDWRSEEELPRPGRLIDKPAPGFALMLWSGETVTLDDFVGQAVVLNFWASWCVPCEKEMPALQQVSEDLAESGANATILGVGIKNDNDGNARELVERLEVTYPIGRDTAGEHQTRGPIETAYGISSYPATVFVRPDGTVYAIRFGEVTEAEVHAYLDGALR
jgi:thiol-disulfide isomerase/thioredoxin